MYRQDSLFAVSAMARFVIQSRSLRIIHPANLTRIAAASATATANYSERKGTRLVTELHDWSMRRALMRMSNPSSTRANHLKDRWLALLAVDAAMAIPGKSEPGNLRMFPKGSGEIPRGVSCSHISIPHVRALLKPAYRRSLVLFATPFYQFDGAGFCPLVESTGMNSDRHRSGEYEEMELAGCRFGRQSVYFRLALKRRPPTMPT